MKSYRIVVLPGDGIGPEIVDAALAVLDKIQELAADFRLSYDFRQAGCSLLPRTRRNYFRGND